MAGSDSDDDKAPTSPEYQPNTQHVQPINNFKNPKNHTQSQDDDRISCSLCSPDTLCPPVPQQFLQLQIHSSQLIGTLQPTTSAVSTFRCSIASMSDSEEDFPT